MAGQDALAGDLGDVSTFVVGSEQTLGQVMVQLRQNVHRLVVVLNDDGGVVGSIIDSDIRRAALSGSILDVSAGEVASRPLAVIGSDTSPAEAEALMRSHRLPCVPVVDDGRFIGIRPTAHPDVDGTPAIAVIMAGGRGQRLRPLTDKVPKPLLKIGRWSIIERIIQNLAAAGVKEVFVAVNYKAELFEARLGSGVDLGVAIHYLQEEEALGTAGPLSILPASPEGPIIVTNGDIVTTVDFVALLDFHRRHSGAVTVTGVPHLSPIPYGVLEVAGHHLLSIEEKPVRSDLCSAGIYVLDPAALDLLPPGCRFEMPELIAAAVAEGLPVNAFPILETWIDIGGVAEFERALMQFAVGEEE